MAAERRGRPRPRTSFLWIYWLLGFLTGFYLGAYIFVHVTHATAQSVDVAAAIHQAAAETGVSEAWLRRVAYCESRYTPWVTSRGGHQGLYQFAPGTWRWMSAQAGLAGASPYD